MTAEALKAPGDGKLTPDSEPPLDAGRGLVPGRPRAPWKHGPRPRWT